MLRPTSTPTLPTLPSLPSAELAPYGHRPRLHLSAHRSARRSRPLDPQRIAPQGQQQGARLGYKAEGALPAPPTRQCADPCTVTSRDQPFSIFDSIALRIGAPRRGRSRGRSVYGRRECDMRRVSLPSRADAVAVAAVRGHIDCALADTPSALDTQPSSARCPPPISTHVPCAPCPCPHLLSHCPRPTTRTRAPQSFGLQPERAPECAHTHTEHRAHGHTHTAHAHGPHTMTARRATTPAPRRAADRAF
jgi:hypothetical protein